MNAAARGVLDKPLRNHASGVRSVRMQLKKIGFVGGAGAWIGYLYTRAKWIADFFGVTELPQNFKEALNMASEAPLLVVYGLFGTTHLNAVFVNVDKDDGLESFGCPGVGRGTGIVVDMA